MKRKSAHRAARAAAATAVVAVAVATVAAVVVVVVAAATAAAGVVAATKAVAGADARGPRTGSSMERRLCGVLHLAHAIRAIRLRDFQENPKCR
jgi:hypothetical protein